MGVSFKVSKTGRKFRQKPLLTAEKEEQPEDVLVAAASKKIGDDSVRKLLGISLNTKALLKSPDDSAPPALVHMPKSLLPFDRASESLFSAIESGSLPASFPDDIPGKYTDGRLFCEVRDYRKCFPEGVDSVSGGRSPVVNKVPLRLSLENVVLDIPDLSDDGWTYGDMMEVESRIVKALQPKLCLDPTPQLDRLSQNPGPCMLKFEIGNTRRKRWMKVPEVAVSSSHLHRKKICLDRAQENSMLGESGHLPQQLPIRNSNTQSNVSGNVILQRSNSVASDGSLLPSSLVSHQSKFPNAVGGHIMMRDQQPVSLLNASVASPGGQDVMIPFVNTSDSSIYDNRAIQDGQSSTVANKKARLVDTKSDGNLQNPGPQVGNLQNSELHWKGTMTPKESIGKGIQYASNGMQKYSRQVFEGGSNQERGPMLYNIGEQGIRYNLKEEPIEIDRSEKPDLSRLSTGESELNVMDSQQPRLQQRMGNQFSRSSFPQSSWNNHPQPFDNNIRKEDSLQKRKLVQSPRVSAGGLPQSPLSSKSGDVSTGSMGPQFGAAVSSGHVQSSKEKSAVTSISSAPVGVGGNLSFNASANDSIQQQNLVQASAKRRSNSLQKTHVVSSVGSPASVSNMSAPVNTASPPIGTQSLGDQPMLERFSKIHIVSVRYQHHFKKNKVDEYPIRKPISYSAQQLASILSNDSFNEDLSDESCKMRLSKSLVGGSMNTCKRRTLNFKLNDRSIQGVRLIMSEKESDGSVAFHIGDIEVADYVAAEDYLPTLPNTHIADLLAAQYCSLMEHEGYKLVDHLQPKQTRRGPASVDGPGISSPRPTSEIHQFSEGVSLQTPNDFGKPSSAGNAPLGSSQNVQLPRTPVQTSQGLLPTFPQMLTQSLQQSQFQRPPPMLSANSVQHLGNMQLSSHMTTKPSALQLHLLQQQQQQNQPPQLLQAQQSAIQRKMMPGLGTVGMSGNNMLALGGLGNVMGIGGARGVGGTGISSPVGSMGNIMNQNPMSLSSAANLSNAIRAGAITPAQATYMKMKMAQSRAAIYGNTQASSGGMFGSRQMIPGSTGVSMLGPSLNRAASMSQIQRPGMGQMGAPKLMPGVNVYMNQQQQQIQQQLQLLVHQRQLQQPETSMPPQDVVSSPQVGSPSGITVALQVDHMQQQPAQQQASSQQMSQRTPMSPQLSSGAVHPMVASNAEAGPASPQLSSQTFGSVGSIANSPMDLQGVNKSNSMNNAQ